MILDDPGSNAGYNPDRLAAMEPAEVPASQGTVIRDFDDLVDLLERIADADGPGSVAPRRAPAAHFSAD